MKILIIDIETTGFSPKANKIVEVGMVELNLETGERKIVFDKVVHEYDISTLEILNSWILKNSDLTFQDITESLPLLNHKPQIQKIINNYPLGCTAFHNKFDFGFMESRGFVFPKKLPCPMLLLTPIMKLPNKKGYGYKWPKVQEAYDYFFPGNDYVEKHRGADDAEHEAQIIFELYKKGEFKLS